MAVLSNPLKGETFKRAGAHFEPLHVVAQDAPNLTVQISAGGYWSAGQTVYVEFAGGTSPLITVPGANAHWVLVTLTTAGAIDLITGVSAPSPLQPTVPEDNRLVLAAIFVNAGTTAITSGMLNDIRPLFQVGHSGVAFTDLTGLTVPDLLPESAITGLVTDLANRPDLTTVTNLLATKADITGTPDSVFTLNADEVGTPSADASLVVERGVSANVSIRWNETTEVWEFTNDGTVFQALPATASTKNFDSFAGTGTATYTTTFNFPTAPAGKISVMVFVDGEFQDGTLGYTATAPNQIVFNAGFIPAVAARVEMIGT